jgi:hypothetical protein
MAFVKTGDAEKIISIIEKEEVDQEKVKVALEELTKKARQHADDFRNAQSEIKKIN